MLLNRQAPRGFPQRSSSTKCRAPVCRRRTSSRCPSKHRWSPGSPHAPPPAPPVLLPGPRAALTCAQPTRKGSADRAVFLRRALGPSLRAGRRRCQRRCPVCVGDQPRCRRLLGATWASLVPGSQTPPGTFRKRCGRSVGLTLIPASDELRADWCPRKSVSPSPGVGRSSRAGGRCPDAGAG